MIDITKCKRDGFKGCFYNGGRIGNFKGEVLQIEGNKYLFKRIFVSYMSYDGTIEYDKEDHVWIMDGETFRKNNIKVGDCVSFQGEVYPYIRKNGTYDLGVRNPEATQKIESYELPSEEYFLERSLQQIKCQTCRCKEYCYGICII